MKGNQPVSRFNRDDAKIIAAFIITGVLIIASVFGWHWYKAGRQQQVYTRQGIQMSQWECFIGVEPAERVMQIKEHQE